MYKVYCKFYESCKKEENHLRVEKQNLYPLHYFVINYSDLKNDAEKELNKTVKFLGLNLDNNLIRKSVEFSSFDKVKKMGKEKNQKYGNGPKNGKFKGEFTRSGAEGQFNSELKKETI